MAWGKVQDWGWDTFRGLGQPGHRISVLVRQAGKNGDRTALSTCIHYHSQSMLTRLHL